MADHPNPPFPYQARQWADEGARVECFSGRDPSDVVHEGRIIGMTEAPTVRVQKDDGQIISWVLGITRKKAEEWVSGSTGQQDTGGDDRAVCCLRPEGHSGRHTNQVGRTEPTSSSDAGSGLVPRGELRDRIAEQISQHGHYGSESGECKCGTWTADRKLAVAYSVQWRLHTAESIADFVVAPVLAANDRLTEQRRRSLANAMDCSHTLTIDELIARVAELQRAFVDQVKRARADRESLGADRQQLLTTIDEASTGLAKIADRKVWEYPPELKHRIEYVGSELEIARKNVEKLQKSNRVLAEGLQRSAYTARDILQLKNDLADARAQLDVLEQDRQAWQGHECEAGCTRPHVLPDGSPFGQPDTEASDALQCDASGEGVCCRNEGHDGECDPGPDIEAGEQTEPWKCGECKTINSPWMKSCEFCLSEAGPVVGVTSATSTESRMESDQAILFGGDQP